MSEPPDCSDSDEWEEAPKIASQVDRGAALAGRFQAASAGSSDAFEDLIFSASHERHNRHRERKQAAEKEIANQRYRRELNPYYKHGGDGLPPVPNRPLPAVKSDMDLKTLRSFCAADKGTFRRPDSHDHQPSLRAVESESHIATMVRGKPIDQWTAKKLGPEYKPKNFVRYSESTSAVASRPPTVDKELLNKLSARILRAEMMGDKNAVSRLKEEMEHLQSADPGAHGDSEGQEVVLVKSDNRKGALLATISDDQQKDASSIQDMFREEKTTAVDFSVDEALFKAAGAKTSNDWTIDDAVLGKKRRPAATVGQEERKRQALIRDHQRQEQTLDSCRLCIDSARLDKHLIVAVGHKSYLAVCANKPMVPNQCCIIPCGHVSSCAQMDEDVFEEMQLWRRSLVSMFRELGLQCVFMENVRNVHHMPHARVDCFPIEPEAFADAPIYFKKAIIECDEEWSDNKRLIDLKKKDIRHSVPAGFSYFSVDFGVEPGFAHVIENERLVQASFGQEILGGILDLPPAAWRNPPTEALQQQLERMKKMKERYKPYDWTEGLKG